MKSCWKILFEGDDRNTATILHDCDSEDLLNASGKPYRWYPDNAVGINWDKVKKFLPITCENAMCPNHVFPYCSRYCKTHRGMEIDLPGKKKDEPA